MRRGMLGLAAIIVSIFTALSPVLADVGPKGPANPPAAAPSNQMATYQSTVTTTYDEGAKEYTVGNKLARGLANILASPLEVPRNIQNMTEEQGVLVGWTGGAAQGLGMTALRIIVGAYEVITFPIPLPAGYRPVIEPEYPWQAKGPKITPQGQPTV